VWDGKRRWDHNTKIIICAQHDSAAKFGIGARAAVDAVVAAAALHVVDMIAAWIVSLPNDA
jgi:hypothetical protein